MVIIKVSLLIMQHTMKEWTDSPMHLLLMAPFQS